MNKQILCTYSIFFTIITYTMEPLYPQIMYNKNSTHNSFAEKLSEKFTITCTQEKNILSHESPHISCIHSDEYLHNLDKHPSSTLAAMNNSLFTWLCPNQYSKSYLTPMLNNVSTTVAATEYVITTDSIPQYKPRYAISLAEGYSFAGYDHGSNSNIYASIPIAAAYALNKNGNIKRILIIDENLTLNTMHYYFTHGNGSIFFPKNNPKLSALFKNKIITHNQIPFELHDFLRKPDNKIDVAFYNINIDDVEPIEDMHPTDAKEREFKIHTLLSHLIPTVFILSGDKNKYQDDTYTLITQISNIAEKISSSDAFEQKWQQVRDDCNTSMQNFMSFLEKHRASIPTPSPIQILHKSSSSSSSFSDLEQERWRLKRKLDMYDFSSNTDDYDNESLSRS
jgi:hypothetical protein